MTKIEGFRVRNFKLLRDVTLGRLWNQRENRPLKPMTAVIGKNGVGKSVLFDAFGFLADALKLGVEEACDARVAAASRECGPRGRRGLSSSRCTTGNKEEPVRLPTRSP